MFGDLSFDDQSGDSGSSTSDLIASIFSDAASVASTAIQTSNNPAPPLYNYGSGQMVSGVGLFPHSGGSGSEILLLAAVGVLAYVLLRKRG